GCGGFVQLQGPQTPNGSGQVTFTTSALSTGSHIIRACYSGTGGGTGTQDSSAVLTQTVNSAAATTISAVSGSGTFGGTATLTATLKRTSDNSPVSGKTITFLLNGNAAGTGTTDASGVATVTGVSLTGINAGSSPNAVSASFAGDSGFQASSGSGTLSVAQASSTTTITCPTSVTFNGSAQTPCS